MALDFNKFSSPKRSVKHVDPISLFQSLKVSDSAINDLWLAQGDALREWHRSRSQSDTAVVLNTGAGKTLVGLLAAQSLVNETEGRVIYGCSSIQLVEQTKSKARGYGLTVTTYANGQFDNDLYRRGIAPCITTYQALFNGKSRFYKDEISGVIFDDAHTVGHVLRDQFTLQIARRVAAQPYAEIYQLFRRYFTNINRGMGYKETYERQDAGTAWFVPPFAVRQQLAELQRILISAQLGESRSTMFAWEYLRDNLDLCTLILTGTEASFSPPVIPVSNLPYFKEGVRRLYLSATLTAPDAFIRTFGRVPTSVVAPLTSAGECERMIIVPSLGSIAGRSRQSDVAITKQVIKNEKCLVIVPSYQRAGEWADIATEYDDDVAEQIEQFKQDKAPACLILTARYDGVDFPGDTCRIVVVDELPTGLNPLERYLWERLGLFKLLRSTVASRIVQSLGRISRGMSDHGVVFLTGDKLIDWMLAPANQRMLPEFIQRQLQLGIAMTPQLKSVSEIKQAVSQCLERNEGWVGFYTQNMEEMSPLVAENDDVDENIRIANIETKFGHFLWDRKYVEAAKVIEQQLDQTFQASRPTGAWHSLWLGYLYDLMDDWEHAEQMYHRASSAAKEIPPYDRTRNAEAADSTSPQSMAVASSLLLGKSTRLWLPNHFDTDLAALDGSGSPAQTEAALDALGQYLGLYSQRPDNEVGTGPDVLWSLDSAPVLSMEVKTDKADTSSYRKADLGQLRDHRQWVREQLGNPDVFSAFVGPALAPTPDSNPDPDIVVIELAVFRGLRDRLRAALVDITTQAVPANAAVVTHNVMRDRQLLWPDVYHGLEKHELRKIQRVV